MILNLSEEAIQSAAVLSLRNKQVHNALKQPTRQKLIELLMGCSAILNDNHVAYLSGIDNFEPINKLLEYAILEKGLFLDCAHFYAWIHRLKKACSQNNILQQKELASCFLPYFILPLSKAYPGITLKADICFANKTIYPYGLMESISISSHTTFQLSIEMPKEVSSKIALLKRLKPNDNEVHVKLSLNQRQFFNFKNIKIEWNDLAVFSELSLSDGSLSDFQPNPYTTLDSELGDAIQLLQICTPEALTEIGAYCQVIVPYCSDTESWKSKTVPEVLYAEGISFKPLGSSLLLAEALIHETAHTKFELLHTIDKLINDDGLEVYQHPWRDEKRTITAILIASHAFLSVTYFYFKAKACGFLVEGTLLKKNLQNIFACFEILDKHAQFTNIGRIFYREMVQLSQKLVTCCFSPNDEPQLVNNDFIHGHFYRRPFEYALLDLQANYYPFFDKIVRYLKNTSDWNFTTTDFYEHWELQFRSDNPISQKLFSQPLLQLLLNTFKSIYHQDFCPFLALGAHKMDKNNYIGIHTDKPRNMGESHRMIISLNASWKDTMGGYFIFLDSENASDVRCAVSPEFGKVISFKCAHLSHHAVSTIKSGSRLTLIIYAWECVDKNQEYMQAIREEERERIMFVEPAG